MNLNESKKWIEINYDADQELFAHRVKDMVAEQTRNRRRTETIRFWLITSLIVSVAAVALVHGFGYRDYRVIEDRIEQLDKRIESAKQHVASSCAEQLIPVIKEGCL